MKNSKKGFTLVELVVVIAILAILAAIAIPVVSNTINSSKISGANSDAQTLELALKEADAQIVAQDKSLYASGTATAVSDVYKAKGIALKSEIVIKGSTYKPVWDYNDEKVYYVTDGGSAVGASVNKAVTKLGDDSTTSVSGITTILSSDTTVVTSLFRK